MKRIAKSRPDRRSHEALRTENARLANALNAAKVELVGLRRSEERLALAIASSSDGVFDWDIFKDHALLDERGLALHGLRPDASVKTRSDWLSAIQFHPADQPGHFQALDDFLAGRIPAFERECRVRHNDGSYHWMRMCGICVRDPSGRPARFVGTMRDIDIYKARQADLVASEERFALAVAGSNDGVFDWDMVSDEMFLSVRGQSLFGLDPGRTTRPRADWYNMSTVHPDDADLRKRHADAYLSGAADMLDVVWRMRHADGSYHWVRVRGVCIVDSEKRPIRMAGSVTDIDSQKRAEAALLQAQRLEVTGTMAGGIAHDFNNILAATLGYGEMALRDAPLGSRLRHSIESILVAGERGRALVERILVFSSGSASAPRTPVSVERIVQEALQLLRATLPGEIQIESRLNAGRAAILGDPTQLHQLVMNLGTNAIYAMGKGGTLQVSLEVLEISAPRVLTSGVLEPGEYVALEVADSGCGIAPESLHRIFDAFFTTKDQGVGTGLGLAMVNNVVAELGGAIGVKSVLGSGSVFSVYVPRIGDVAPDVAVEAPLSSVGSHEQVLVIDDESALVSLMTVSLSELGYVPVGFTSSLDALAAFRAHPDRFDVVVTDERMPEMQGSALIRELRIIRPSVPIILLSGYVGGIIGQEAIDAGADELLKKPLSKQHLAAAIARVLVAAKR
ncbi:PAS domain-containing protein [Variovorax sp. dw_308]|uniref:PAS domain-containing protein n=1 Tax=Variovorax sp. dw_308 TaxID=2721546 RepID=UPI001C458D05|nr:PAS domain-containing protein [Variovorax sp. dw_308]